LAQGPISRAILHDHGWPGRGVWGGGREPARRAVARGWVGSPGFVIGRRR
jgi:hypothetical protein